MTENNRVVAVGYARVSTEEQAKNGLSLSVQEGRIRAMATVKNANLTEVILDEGQSAKNLNRPGMVRLLTLMRERKIGCVIVAKIDRLTRSVRDLAELVELANEKHVALVSVSETLDTGTAAGRMVLNMIVTVAQWERETISERTTEVLRTKKAAGQRVGKVPYGYRAEGKMLVEDDYEQSIIAYVKGARDRSMSMRRITDQLNSTGCVTRSGKPWRHQYVAAITKKSASKKNEP